MELLFTFLVGGEAQVAVGDEIVGFHGSRRAVERGKKEGKAPRATESRR
jgi:hypothetical protein